MHTAICAFDDRATAEQARDRLLQAGFDRHDVHLQRRESDAAVEELRTGGVEHEVAVGPRVLGAFFDALLGERHPHADTYRRHVESGRTVVVVDAHEEEDIIRAHEVLRDLEAAELRMMHRPERRPLREILGPRGGEPPVTVQQPAGAAARPAAERERAVAASGTGAPRAGGGETGRAGLRGDDEAGRPDTSRDGLGRTRKDD